MGDDEIVDAELVEDDLLPVASHLAHDVVRETGTSLVPQRDIGSDIIWVPLRLEQRSMIREALGWFHDKGPRVRSTQRIMDLMNFMADQEVTLDCDVCNSTGKVRTMYAMTYCTCPIGVQRREEQS